MDAYVHRAQLAHPACLEESMSTMDQHIIAIHSTPPIISYLIAKAIIFHPQIII